MTSIFISPENLTTGQAAEKMGSAIIGKVGYFYAKNGVIEPRVAGKLVKVTGFYRQSGRMVFTFSSPASVTGGFTTAPDVRFAAYADQDEANEVFAARSEAYADLYKTYNTYSFRGDKEAAAYARAAYEALLEA